MGETLDKYSKKGIRSSYLSTILGISLVLFLIGIVISGYIGLRSIEKDAKQNVQCDVFLKPELKDADIKVLQQKISDWREFSKVEFVSSERALQDFSDNQLSNDMEFSEEASIIPPSLTVYPKSEFATKEEMDKICKKLQQTYPEIDEVFYDSNQLERINLGFQQIAIIFISIALLLLVLAIAMINNTIRMSIYSKRMTIKTMQLVGATKKFIRKPFIRTALTNGIISSLIAIVLLVSLFYSLNNVLETVEITFNLEDLIILLVSLLVLGVFVTFVSTWFALNRFLRTNVDKLY